MITNEYSDHVPRPQPKYRNGGEKTKMVHKSTPKGINQATFTKQLANVNDNYMIPTDFQLLPKLCPNKMDKNWKSGSEIPCVPSSGMGSLI